MTGQEVQEYRVGRNFIRVGDWIRVKPSRPKKKDGGPAKVKSIRADEQGNVVGFWVIKESRHRFYAPERIERMAQTKNGERKERH